MFIPTTGASGAIHRSKAEAAMSHRLLPLGIVAHDAYYPQPFLDAEGIAFNAMSDFLCPSTGIYFESKSGSMNGIKSKTYADKAMSRFEADLARGFIHKWNHDKKKLDASWSASVPKFKAVQYQLAEAGGCVVLVFDMKPDADTIRRLDRAKVFWCVVGDECFRKFMSFRTLARFGIRADYTINGHGFEAHGGINQLG